MDRRTPLSLAAVLALVLLLTGCIRLPLPPGLGGSTPTRAALSSSGSVTLNALYAAGDSGGVAQQTVSVAPSDDGELRIDFSENEVSGFGDMTRAASWNAVTVATLLTGAPLDRQYRFAFDGQIDGPSAGALTTVGVLSLLLGDTLRPDATMTGTINPTGTVGTVGGIPEKIQGVIDDGTLTTVLIPAGQRNTPDASGALVDVVELGRAGGVEVLEVATIYDAYSALTGSELPVPAGSADPKVGEVGYDKLAAAGDDALARFDRALAEF
ncbi:MAG: S16 family serine protease, partial [Herbiconiux sp.]|nr:S16 family serine protease [Herbiconiux sp.]